MTVSSNKLGKCQNYKLIWFIQTINKSDWNYELKYRQEWIIYKGTFMQFSIKTDLC